MFERLKQLLKRSKYEEPIYFEGPEIDGATDAELDYEYDKSRGFFGPDDGYF